MSGHLLFVVLGAGVALVSMAVFAYNSYRQSHNYYEYNDEPRISQFERRILGPCGICRGDASTIDSWQAPCGHHLHHTCTVGIARESNSNYSVDYSQICMGCLQNRMERNAGGRNNAGLRTRTRNAQQCVNCLLEIRNETQNTRTMECGHRVHEACWKRMQDSASTTCPGCREEENA